MIQSDGALVKTTTLWEGTTRDFPGWDGIPGTAHWASYGHLYVKQPWVRITVDKLAGMTARLPLKVYEHDDQNRPEAPDHPYAQLLARPNRRLPFVFFWLWVSATYDIYGEAFLGKIRDRGGRPVQLLPLHPTGMRIESERDGVPIWTFQNGKIRVEGIPDYDLVHPRTYNPDSTYRGLSKLESLRSTLELEDFARRAQTSFWKKGARPSVALTTPKELSEPAAERLKARWDAVASGADNTGATVVLEEGMKPEVLSVSAEDAQYIEGRKLNREEVVAAYDMPPPAVHILDNATFSNITEQFRSIYRDTQGPRLKVFEGFLETELRAAVRPGNDEPDFGDGVYAEFLLDEVLRGDFEGRADAYSKADFMTLAEKRQRENLPFIPGTDRLFLNAASRPVAGPDGPDDLELVEYATAVGTAAQRLGAGVLTQILTPEEARLLLPDLDGPPPAGDERHVLAGRLSRQKTLFDVDAVTLVDGLNGSGPRVAAELGRARAEGLTVDEFRKRLAAL